MTAHRRLRTRKNSLAVAATALLAGAASPAGAATCTWNTGAGNWNALANWLSCVAGNGSPTGTPGGADTAVIGATGSVTVSNAQAINTLNNAGVVTVNDNISLSLDARSTGASFFGGGQIVLGGAGARLRVEGANGVTVAGGSTIRGAGQIGQAVVQSGNSLFSNAGTLSADANGLTLQLVNPGNGGSYANSGLMEARNGGTLDIASTVAQSATGQVRAEAGSMVQLNGATVSGGTVGSTGTGRIRATSNFNNLLSGTTLAGVVDMASTPSWLRISDGLTFSNGAIDVGSSSVLYLDNRTTANQLISGTGSINLAGGALRMEGTGQTTTGANVAIRGHGTVGQATLLSGQHTWINNGLVSADVSGQTLNLVPPGNGGQPIQNNGILEAINGGRLLLSADIDAATGSQMRAGTGSVVEMNGVRVTGTINTTGTGSFLANGNFNNVLSGVTLNGNLDMATLAASTRVSEGLVLNGAINVGGSSVLYLDNRSTANQLVSGTGSINLAGGALRMEGNGQTTTGANVAIRGHGTVGQATVLSGQHTWINNGLVSADVSGQTLNLAAPGNGNVPFQNNGILESINGGRLLLSADIDAATGSQMRAGSGSVIEMNGVRVTGTINTTGTGSFRANGNFNNVLSGVTLNGNLDMASLAASTRVSEGLALNGAINVGGSSVLYLDNRSTANQSISGTGSINLAGGALRMEGTGQTTTGTNVAVRGHGTVGQATVLSGQHTWINNGLVSADVSGQTLNLVPPGNGGQPIQHNGILQATGGGTLQISANVVGGAGSRYDVDAASRIVMNGVTLSGVVNQTGTGAIDVSGSSENVLSGSSLAGRINMGTSGPSSLRVSNGMAMNGGATINVGGSSVLSFDNRAPVAAASQNVSGSGQIVMNGGALRFEGGTSTTWDSGVTVRGNGSIGQATVQTANHTLVNNGTIVADGGALNIVPIGNLGRLNGTGTLRIDGGALSLGTGQPTNQGTLDMRATGTLALGTQNLVLSSDYTNAQAGSGNAFNRRAGVTGSGQIQAGGDVQQVISGASVTGGNTANATMTIGNVRVGVNQFDYTIGNGGTAGPTLRGAVQTNVNGANLTDARLAGSGVTAGNYNAGAPAGSGQTRAVTFTVGNAGALAPMSGQVLNLRSTYDNIADQKLNIVLGSGAAAYNAAVGSAATPVQLANQRVGGSNSALLSISNTAAPGAFSEDLNANVASVGGQASASGSVLGRLAGTGNTGSGAISVAVNSATAGAKTGVVHLNYESAGAVAGVSNGLGTLGVGGQAVTVSGNVYQAASGAIQTGALNFGTVQVGQSVSQSLVIRNTATGAAGFVEDLHASFGATSGTGSGLISGTGSLNSILAGTNSNAGNGSMVVSVNTSAAATVSGSIAVNYTSAGAVGGVSNGLGTLAVGSEAYGVAGMIQATANVINQASPLVNNPTINLGAVRVGAASPTAQVSVSNQATAAPQAALNATITSGGAPVTAGGSFDLLNPGATSTALQVGLNTAVAGNFTGANAGKVNVAFVSDAGNVGGCAPNCQLALASQDVTVSGKVYTAAQGQLATPVVDFGIVRVGDTVSARNITVSNTAAVTALNDTLRASVSGLSGPFTAGGAATGVAAQGSGQIGVSLDASSAGVFNQNGSVGFTSQNADMADVSAGPNTGVQVMAQVNNLANGDFDLLAGLGLLTQQSNGDYVLNLGNIALGSNGHWLLQFDNDVSGPADALRGLFDLTGVDDFGLGGFGTVAGLEAGQAQGGLAIDFSATQLGSFQDEVHFRGFSYNASDPDGLTQDRRLLIRASVFDPNGGGGSVPEPGTLALLVLAALAGRRATRTAASTATRH
jgi:hypothetical protein